MKFSGLILSLLVAGCILGGCDNFEYHPYSVKIHGRRNINNTTIAELQAKGLRTPFKFAFLSDTQGSYDDTADLLDAIKERGDIDFIVHGGDVSDFGLPKEFMWCRDQFDATGIPYVTLLGNHDCLGNGKQSFEYIFGDINYSFTVANTRFVCLNTIALEYDYSEPVPDLDFIESDILAVRAANEIKADSVTHTVVAMHSRPYDEQFNNNVAKVFNKYISSYPGLQDTDAEYDLSDETDPRNGGKVNGFCINGHNHNVLIKDIFGNGILYYQCANAGKKQFFVFTIHDKGYECENVQL